MSGIEKTQSVLLPVLKQETSLNKELMQKSGLLLKSAFAITGINLFKRNMLWWYLSTRMKKQALKGDGLKDIEQKLRPFFRKAIDHETVYVPAATKRAERLTANIAADIVGETVADLGAGNGLISDELHFRYKKQVTPIDVIDYSLGKLPITLFTEGNKVPLPDNSVDTTIIYLVLHHSDDPVALLKEAVRITKKRIIIMEGYVDDEGAKEVNGFLDWFLNRIVQGVDMNLPLNYKTTSEWKRIFEELGLKLITERYVGIDEPVAPEEHVYFVLDELEANA